MSGINDPEPAPNPNGSTAIWDLVIADMQDRDNVGLLKYGTRLQAGNGRKPLVDAYQEALDLVVYLRQEIEERKILEQKIADMRAEVQSLLAVLKSKS